MTHPKPAVVAALAATAVLLLWTPTGNAVSQSIRQVFVTNWPVLQTVEGSVTVAEPVHQSELRVFERVIVPPVAPTDTMRLVDAGVLVTDGFPSVVLSLHGLVRGSVTKPGTVGAFLVPDEETIQQALNEQAVLHFALEVHAGEVSARTPYFASDQPRYTVGFRTYRVLLYNTTDKTVTANLFAYLTA